MDREMQLENDVETKVVTLDEMQQNNPYGGKVLKVYVDLDYNTYYIKVFAAYSLGFISYEVACQLSDAGNEYYQITEEILERLKQIFEDRIEYEYFKKNELNKERIKEPEYNDPTNIDYNNNIKKDLYDDYIDISSIDGYSDNYNSKKL